jgi:mercuric ion transport protein
LNIYVIAPRLKTKGACEPGDDACGEASTASKITLGASSAIYFVGFFVAYVLGPILSRLDR